MITEKQLADGYRHVNYNGVDWYGAISSDLLVQRQSIRACPWCGTFQMYTDTEWSLPPAPPYDEFCWLYHTYECGVREACTTSHIVSVTGPTDKCKSRMLIEEITGDQLEEDII